MRETEIRDNQFVDITHIYYKKFDNNANILVDNRRLTTDEGALCRACSGRPKMVVDSYNNIHLIWVYDRDDEIYYKKLDNDGTTLVDDTRLTTTRSYINSGPNTAIDSNDNIHIVWGDDKDTADQEDVYYIKGVVS